VFFYEIYNNPSFTKGRIEHMKTNGSSVVKNNIEWMQRLYTYGFIIIFVFLLVLALSFSGDAEQILTALFLILLVFSIGIYYTYLYTTGQVEDLTGSEKQMSSATIGLFITLAVSSVYYVLFTNKSSKQVLIMDFLQLSVLGGTIVFFLMMFGIGTGVAFQTMMPAEYSGTTGGIFLWASFGTSLFVLLALIISYLPI